VCLPLLIFPCTIKSRSSFLAPAHLGGPGRRAVKRLWWCGGLDDRKGILPVETAPIIPKVSGSSEPCKNGSTDRDVIWVEDLGGPKEPCIRWGPDPPMGRGNFDGRRGNPL